MRITSIPSVIVNEPLKQFQTPNIVNDTNVLVLGFASRGETYLPITITSIKEFLNYFGYPETEIEFYFYLSVESITNNGGTALCIRLPYDNVMDENYKYYGLSAFISPDVPIIPTPSLSAYNWYVQLESENASRHKVTTSGDSQLTGSGTVSLSGAGGGLFTDAINTSDWAIGNDYTIQFWVKTTYVAGNQFFASLFSSIANEWYFRYLPGTTQLSFYGKCSNGNGYIGVRSTTDCNITDGEWHHIALVKEGSVWRVFLDGINKFLDNEGGTGTTLVAYDKELDIGRRGNGTDSFVGEMDQFEIRKDVVYSANFTPPTRTDAITVDAFTCIALNFNGTAGSQRIIDSAKPSYPSKLISVVIGNFDFDNGEAFYLPSALSPVENIVYGNGANDSSNTITWIGYNTSPSYTPIKLTVGGTEYYYGRISSWSTTAGNVGYNTAFSVRRYFLARGYHLYGAVGEITKISIPISTNTASYNSSNGSFEVRLYAEEITNGLNLNTLTPIQTGTLTLIPANKGTYVDVILTAGTTDDYNDIETDPGAIVKLCPDVSDNEFDGISINNPIYNSISSNAIEFNSASSQYIEQELTSDVDITGRFTMFATIQLSRTTGTTMIIVHKGENQTANANQYYLALDTGTNTWRGRIGNGTTNYDVTSADDIDTNPHVLVLQYEPSTHLKLWIDGVLKDTNITSIPSSLTTRTEKMTVGAHSGSSGKIQFFDGKMWGMPLITTDLIGDDDILTITELLSAKMGT